MNSPRIAQIRSRLETAILARAPGSRAGKLRAKLSRTMFEHNIQKPTVAELEEGHEHAEHEHELESGLDHPASGHEFDDHQLRDAGDVPLRGH